jgi:hypothetical protein
MNTFPIGPTTQLLSPRRPKERRDLTNAFAYRPAKTVTAPTPTKRTEARPDQRPCLSANHHSDLVHADQKNRGETRTMPLPIGPHHSD